MGFPAARPPALPKGVTYDWRARADEPLLRHLPFPFRPVFAANRRWAMVRGETSLRRELARRRAPV